MIVRTVCESSRARSMRSSSAAALGVSSFMKGNRGSRQVGAVRFQTGVRSAKMGGDQDVVVY